jgi:putative ABC transport system permease protein
MSETINDLRHALRRLVRAPAFTAAAALTLALGIAANTAIFTVVERVILRPLPYDDSDRLIWVDHVAPGIDLPGNLGLSQGLYEYYRQRTRTFESLALFRKEEWTLTGVGDPQRLTGAVATASLMDALRARPLIGRWFTEKEAQDAAHVVVINHALWSSRFGREPNIIGRMVQLNGTSREVIGVMPPSFAFPDPTVQLFQPERINEQQIQTVGGFNYRSIARLRDGIEVADVERELDAFIAALKTDFPNDGVAQQALDAVQLGGKVMLLKDQEVGSVRRTLWVLLAMVGLVLLIACANVANLFLVRSEARQREIAVRRALGAGRIGIIRYFLAESALLSTASAAIALVLAWGAVRLLVRFGPENVPRLHEVAVGTASIGWTVLLALCSTVLFGAVPLMRRAHALAPTLREGGRGSTAGRARFRTRNALMAAQVALALVLLIVSGLMVRSFLRLRAVDPGFDARGVLTFDVSLARNDYPSREAASGFHDALLERVRALPGVESAGAVSCLPLTGSCWGDPLLVRGRPLQPGELPPIAQIRRALPGFFEALRMPLLEGRTLQPADHQQRTNAVVISRAFARVYFPGEDALGKQVAPMFSARPGELTQPPDSAWFTVVGIVDDTPIEQLGEANPYPLIYLPAIERMHSGNTVHGMSYAVRAAVDPLSLVRAVRAALAEIDSNVALGRVRSMETVVSEATARMEFTMVLLVIAGGVALLLGAVGIYGVISYVVGQRTGEIGVRMALGARPGDVSGMVLRQSGAVIGTGLLLGLVAALGLTRLMSSLLFGVTAADPITYAAVTTFLLTIAAVASWLPARKAAALDPTAALRVE